MSSSYHSLNVKPSKDSVFAFQRCFFAVRYCKLSLSDRWPRQYMSTLRARNAGLVRAQAQSPVDAACYIKGRSLVSQLVLLCRIYFFYLFLSARWSFRPYEFIRGTYKFLAYVVIRWALDFFLLRYMSCSYIDWMLQYTELSMEISCSMVLISSVPPRRCQLASFTWKAYLFIYML